MRGFARMPNRTAKAFSPEGFFLRCDLGITDEEGCVRIARRKETILRGGDQICPREVEDQLHAHPAIDDVCVIGVPHEILGELVCAYIVPVKGAVVTEAELEAFAHDTMADCRDPRSRPLRRPIPRHGDGKVKRRELECLVALDHTATSGRS